MVLTLYGRMMITNEVADEESVYEYLVHEIACCC